MSGALFFSFVGSLIICMALIPPLMATAGRLHFLDLPNERKVHSGPVAKVGGLAFAAGTFIAILVWAPRDEILVSSLIGGAIILAFGAWDDKVGLNYKIKFLGQLVAAGVVIWLGGVRLTSLPLLPDGVLPEWLSFTLTIVMIVGVTNAINLADGLDGLAGGLSMLSFAGMAYLAYLSGDTIVMLMVVSVLGGLLGFLRFNTYPARIFMGDAGSQFLGFYLAIFAIVSTDSTRGPYSPALIPFILGLPILDTLGVICQRLKEGRSPFVADQNHIHHKLLATGLSHHEAVLIIYFLQAGMVSLAYLLRWEPDMIVLAIYVVLAVAIVSLFIAAGHFHLKFVNRPGEQLLFGTSLNRIVPGPWLTKSPIRLLGMTVPVFLVLSIFLPRRVPEDMGYTAIILFGIILTGLLSIPKAAPLLVRGGLYVGSTFVMYLTEQSAIRADWNVHTLLNVFFMLLAMLVMLTIRFSVGHRFQTTPLDYLMVFLALIIPILPEMRVGDINLSLLTAKLIVLFFAFELLLHAFSERLTQLGLVSLWLLFGLGIRAWW
ncbi:MAG: glycosyltransferase family 4 protein [Nitrospiraceae bacterium]